MLATNTNEIQGRTPSKLETQAIQSVQSASKQSSKLDNPERIMSIRSDNGRIKSLDTKIGAENRVTGWTWTCFGHFRKNEISSKWTKFSIFTKMVEKKNSFQA
jgi:hypothetical protein